MLRNGHSARAAVLVVAAIGIAVATALVLAAPPVRADGGVPIPAPAGTEWSIVAGYNTGTHSEADGQDQHAIDIVRTDAASDWTPVLSPVDGVVTWFDHNCLTIADSNDYAHLLCHLAPDDHIQRGLRVNIGDQVGLVFPVGYDANGGIAHIHYAIHGTYGGGYLDRSTAFTGDYALEGRNLSWTDEYNLHSGLEFTSTNARDWTAPTVSSPEDNPPDPPEPETNTPTDKPSGTEQEQVTTPEPQPEPQPVWTIPADAPVGGWRKIGVQANTSVAGFFANLNAPLSEFVVHNAGRQTYDRFDPNDPGSADVAVRSLKAGQAVWALVQPDAAWLPEPPTKPKQVTIRLSTSANLISWQGPERNIDDALKNVAHLSYAYQYDSYTQTWRFWSADGPAFLNSLTTLKTGDALYIVVRVGSVWTQLP